MQATLSSTASGKHFRTGTLTAVLPCFSAEVEASDVVHPASDSLKTQPLTMQPGSVVEPASGSTLRLAERSSHARYLAPFPVLPETGVAEGAGLAHDAGNLLGALGLYCDLLRLPGVLREEHRHYAEELQLLSGRSRRLIERLLNPATTGRPVADGGFAERSRATDTAVQPVEPIAVPDVIEGCRGLLDVIARRAVEVAYGAGAALPVAVPRESLERILVNLTKNAAEALGEDGPAEGAITLRVSCLRAAPSAGTKDCDRIVLTVEDKGCGMSSAAVKVLLGEGSAPAAGREGHGIGFRVVRELVGASGGRLRLRSRGGCGTTVEITWAVASLEESEPGLNPLAHSLPNPVLNPLLNPLEDRRRLMLVARGRAVAAGRLSC